MKNFTLFIYFLYIVATPFFHIMEATFFPVLVYVTLLILIIALSYYWALISVKTIKEKQWKTLYLRRYKTSLTISAFLLWGGISMKIFHYFQSNIFINRFANSMGVLFCFSFIYILFLAAKALTYSEKKAYNKNANLFGTFLLYFYLPIGIFSISARLEKLKQLL